MPGPGESLDALQNMMARELQLGSKRAAALEREASGLAATQCSDPRADERGHSFCGKDRQIADLLETLRVVAADETWRVNGRGDPNGPNFDLQMLARVAISKGEQK